MSDLQDILLNIVVSVQNSGAMQGIAAQMAGVNALNDKTTKSSSGVEVQNWRTVKSWQGLSENISKAELKMDGVFRAGMRMQQLGETLTGFGKTGAGFFLNAANAFGEFDMESTKVAASAQIFDKMNPMFGNLQDTIKQTSIDMKFMPIKDITDGFYQWITTTGQQINNLDDLKAAQTGVESAMKTAIITNTDYGDVIKGGYSVMKQYGMQLTDMPKIMAGLHVETIRTSAEFSDLIQSFKFVGPTASALGMSFDDTAQALGLLADEGQRGSQAGRGLGMFLTKLIKPTKDNKEAFNELMLSTQGVSNAWDKMIFPNGEFEGFNSLVSQLAGATQNMTQQERLNYLSRIASTQNAARVIIPLVNAQIDAYKHGSDIFNDPKYSIAGAMQQWSQQWEMVSGSWKGMTEELKRIIEVIVLDIGARVAEIFTPLIEKANAFLQVLEQWMKDNPQIMDLVVKIGVAVSAALLLFGALFSAVGLGLVLAATMSIVSGALMTVIAPILVLVGLFGTLAYAYATNAGGIRDAVGQLVATLQSMFGPMLGSQNALKSWGDILNWAKGVAATFAKIVADKIMEFNSWLLKMKVSIAQAATDPNSPLSKLFSILGTIKQYAPDLMALVLGVRMLSVVGGGLMVLSAVVGPLFMFATGLGTLKSVVGTGIDLAKTGGSIVTFVLNLGGALAGPVIGALGGLADGLVAVGGAIVGIVGGPALVAIGIIAAIAAVAFVAYDQNWFGFRDVVNGVIDSISQTVQQWMPTMQTAFANVQSYFATMVGYFMTSVNNIVTALQKIAQPIEDLVNNNLPAMQSAWQGLVDSVTGFINNLVSTVQTAIQTYIMPALQNLLDAVGNFVTMLETKLGPTIQKFLDMVGAFFNNVLMPIWSFLVSTLGPVIGAVIGTLIGLFEQLLAAAQPVIDFLINSFASVAGTIINAIATALNFVTGLIGGFLDFLGQIFDFFTAIFSGNFQQAFDILKGIVDTAITNIKGAFQTGLDFIANLWNTIWTGIQNVVKTILDTIHGIIQGALDAVSTTFNNVFNGIKGVVDGVMNGIRDTITNIWNGIKGFFDTTVATIKSTIQNGFNFIHDVITNVLNGIHDTVWGVIDGIVNFLGGSTDKLKKIIDDAFTSMRNTIQNILDGISNTVHNIIDGIVNFFRTSFDNTKNTVSNTFDQIKSTVQNALNTISNTFHNIIDGIVTFVRTSFDNVLNTVSSIFNQIKATIQTALDWISNTFHSILDGVLSYIRNTFNSFLQAGKDMVTNVINGISGLFGNLLNAGQDILNKVGDGIKNVIGSMLDIGRQIVQGLWDGIQRMGGWIKDQIVGFINSIIPGPVKDILGIHSPSRVMAELGGYAMEGLAVGILQNKSAAQAMQDQISGVMSAAQQFHQAADFMSVGSEGGLSITTDNHKYIHLAIEVTSPDGSVSNVDVSRLTSELEGSSLVEALEAAAAAD